MEFFVVGEAVECDIDIYPLKSIWREDTNTNILTLKKEGEFEANICITENGLIIKTLNPNNRIHTELFNLSGEKLFAKQLYTQTFQSLYLKAFISKTIQRKQKSSMD